MRSTGTAIRVLIADDQTVVREGIALLVGLLDGIEVAGVARDGEEAVTQAVELMPDVVLLDLRMPLLDGVAALARIRAEAPGVEVVVLSTYADEASVLGALRAGARGYLTKDATAAEIEQAIRDAARGRTRLDAVVGERLVELVSQADGPSAPQGLTSREAEVLQLIARGLTNRDIARTLVVTEATVKTHVNNLLRKLGVSDRAAAVALAYRWGLADSPGGAGA
ncbi:MAG: response regulator [Mycobacteriales bacterium]